MGTKFTDTSQLKRFPDYVKILLEKEMNFEEYGLLGLVLHQNYGQLEVDRFSLKNVLKVRTTGSRANDLWRVDYLQNKVRAILNW